MASGWVSCARVKETLVNRTTIVFTISRLKIRQSMIQKKSTVLWTERDCEKVTEVRANGGCEE